MQNPDFLCKASLIYKLRLIYDYRHDNVLLGQAPRDLQYAQYQHDDDIPTLRLLCVKLSQSMSRHGFADDPAVQQWLHEGKDDPFPEVRNAAMPPKSG